MSRPRSADVRLEDARLLRGEGRFVADRESGISHAHAVIVRSPHAHARIRSIDATRARRAPGVLAVLTGRDVESAGLGPVPCLAQVDTIDGAPLDAPPWCLLASHTARHVGDGVAMVVAETLEAARDAAETLDIEYEPLAAHVTLEAPERRCFGWAIGDADAVEAAFAAAHRVVSIEAVNSRVIVSPLETRGAIGRYDPAAGRYTLYTPTQGVHGTREMLARPVLDVDERTVRVLTDDVGGGFGIKFGLYPEQALVLFAAKAVGRTVRWIAERADAFVADMHARDHLSRAALALDAQDHILGLRIDTTANLGAYLTSHGPNTATVGYSKVLGHVYRVPAALLRVEGVLTNTAPVEAYRGAGGPEIVYLVERLIEKAARSAAIDRIEFRRRNLIPPAAMPYTNPSRQVYRDCDFERVLDAALANAEWADFPARRAQSRARDRRRGIGLSFYLHGTGASAPEHAQVRLAPDGHVEVRCGTQDSGQGHRTSFARLVANRLEIPLERIRVLQGDSDAVPGGSGTGGSSSLLVGSQAILIAVDRFIDRARELAAEQLETATADIELEAGMLRVVGTDRSIRLLDLTVEAPAGAGHPCAGHGVADEHDPTWPNGVYVCEVEVDPQTGTVELARFTATDDIGEVVNPAIALGQIHGGVAQGIGQALFEHTVYAADSGQLISGSFMDYCLPRADALPTFECHWLPMRPDSGLGAKGVGEVGPIGAPPAVLNAIADALGHDDIDMPATPERVWRALAASHAEAGLEK